MKRTVILSGMAMLYGQQLQAQVVSLNGAYISTGSNTIVKIDTLRIDNSSTNDNAGTHTLASIINDGIVQGNGTYTISNLFTNTGTFNAGSGTVHFNGSISQDIPGLIFYNLTLSGASTTKTAAGTVNILNTLTLSDNTTLALGSNNIKLRSDSTYTARVAAVPSTATITYGSGRFIAERYIKGRRKYRIMTSSVTTSPNATLSGGEEGLSIWGNWQNQGNNSTANAGTFVTGGTAADGFDQQTTNASLFTYNSTTRLFDGFTTANGKNTKYTPLKGGVPYYMFVWGDRTNSPITSNPYKTVLTATGTLLTGDQTHNTGSSIPLSNVVGGYTMIGNPFASPIDWATVSRTNLSDTYWGWDPNLSSTGGYVTVSTTGTVTLIAPFSGSTGLDQYIQSGQGFFVKTTAASPVLTIMESDKVSNFNGIAFRTYSNNIPLIAVNLLYDDVTGSTLMDGALAAFDPGFSNQVGNEDATKFLRSGEGLAIELSSELLSIDARKMPAQGDTLLLNIARLSKPQYRLQIFAKQMDNTTLEPYLEDSYLKTSRLLSLTDTNYVTFTYSNSIAASYNVNRFQIVFRKSGELSDVITSIKAEKQNKQVRVSWEVSSENGIQKYEIQRADDGNGFIKIGEVMARAGTGVQHYEWMDNSPVKGTNHYRIRLMKDDGSVFFSKTVTALLGEEKPELKIFPNPVQNYEMNVQFINLEKGKYTARIINAKGQIAMDRLIDYDGGSANQWFQLSRQNAAGVYFFLLSNGKVKLSQPIIIK